MSALFTALAVPDYDFYKMQDTPAITLPPREKSRVRKRNDSHVITLTSVKEQTGVTTVSMMLATLLQQRLSRKFNVAVLDLNLSHPDLYSHTENNFCEFLSLSDTSSYSLDEISKARQSTCQNFDCFTIFGDRQPGMQESTQLKKLIEKLSESYDIIIVDTASYNADNLYTMLALQNSDIVLCVSLSDERSLMESEATMQEFMSTVMEGGLELYARTGVLLNQTTTDLLTLHKRTQQIRENLDIVGSFPKLSLPNNHQKKLEQLITDKNVLDSGTLIIKHLFSEF